MYGSNRPYAKTEDSLANCGASMYGMDTALPSGNWARLRAPRTERHQCAKVELRHNHLRNGGPR